MNRFRYILAIAATSLTWCACEHDVEFENTEVETAVPTEGYIFFDTEVATRSELIQNYLYKDFAVLGYKYASDWNTVKPQASQEKTFIHNSATTTMGVFEGIPEEVTWDDENKMHSYEPMKEWDKDLTYSFFAWYPKECTSNGKSYEGNPYIDYTLDTTDPSNHIDVMTACVIDTKSASSKSVSFTMEHRLSALDIVARSYVNAQSLGLDAGTTAKVKINNVGLKLENMLYNQVRIPLNTKDDNEQMVGSNTGSTTVDFGTLVSDKTIDYYDSTNKLAMLTYNVGKTLLLIPQADELKCTVSVSYDIVNDADVSIWDEVYAGVEESQRPDKTPVTEVTIKELKEGMYYYLLLNFTKSGITVVVLEADAWEDKDIDYEFD